MSSLWITLFSLASQGLSLVILPYIYLRISSFEFSEFAYLQTIIGIASTVMLFKRDISYQRLDAEVIRGRFGDLFIPSMIVITPFVSSMLLFHGTSWASTGIFAATAFLLFLFSANSALLVKQRGFLRYAIARFLQSAALNVCVLIWVMINGSLGSMALAFMMLFSYGLSVLVFPSPLITPNVRGVKSELISIFRNPLLSFSPLANAISVNYLLIACSFLFAPSQVSVLAFTLRILLAPVNLIAQPLSLEMIGGGVIRRWDFYRKKMLSLLLLAAVGVGAIVLLIFPLRSYFPPEKFDPKIWSAIAVIGSIQLIVVPFSQIPLLAGFGEWVGRWEWMRAISLVALFFCGRLISLPLYGFLLVFILLTVIFYSSILLKVRMVLQ